MKNLISPLKTANNSNMPKSSHCSIIAIVLSCSSIVVPLLNLFFAVPSLIFGIIGMCKIRKNRKITAVLGLVLSFVAVLIFLFSEQVLNELISIIRLFR